MGSRLRAYAVLLAAAALLGCEGTPVRHAHAEAGMGHGHAAAAPQSPEGRRAVLDLRQPPSLDEVVAELAPHRVVVVGESHTRMDHHRNQLAIIRGLHGRAPDLAIGVEFFQRPFQAALDDYVAGRIDEAKMLARTGYFDRWRFDYRLYRPILRYAREHGIPVVALNLPAGLTREVARGGRGSLGPEQRARLPETRVPADAAYRDRLREVFDRHPNTGERRFEDFVAAQLLWDEGMAEQAAAYLQAHPGRRMVVLAGNGHAVRGGIPVRIEARLGLRPMVVVNGLEAGDRPEVADFVVLSDREVLPAPGRMGIFLEIEGERVIAADFEEDSPAAAAGMEAGDRILALDGRPVRSMADIRIAMIDKEPGDRVAVEFRRQRLFLGAVTRTVRFQVH